MKCSVYGSFGGVRVDVGVKMGGFELSDNLDLCMDSGVCRTRCRSRMGEKCGRRGNCVTI